MGIGKKTRIQLLAKLHELELIQDDRALTNEEYSEWVASKEQLESLYKEEEQYWAVRAKQRWLEEGYANTKFFHTIATHRKKSNRINFLVIGSIITINN